MKKALIIVDVQRDFCPGGALPAPKGNEVIPVINALMKRFEWVVASKDWHPARTIHFDKWPPHCIRATPGASFHPGLDQKSINTVALKGTGNSDDGYSAFEATNMDLSFWLGKNGIEAVYLTGLTTEYCVKASAQDALKAGFKVYIVKDAVAAVEAQTGDHEKALKEMEEEGMTIVTSNEVS